MNTATHQATSAAGPATVAIERTRVWDLPTRIFHWSLALSFAAAWLSADSERWRDLHVMFGYTFVGLIAFRMLWGVIGSRYARFASFAFGPRRVLGYLRSLLTGAPEHHLGHNPAGALAIFAMLALGVAVAATGFASYQEVGGEWLEELHEGAAEAMLALVLVHVAGVLVSSLLHGENLARAMVTGWKSGRPADGIRSVRPVAAVLLSTALIGLWGAWQTGVADAWLPGATVSAGPAGHGGADDDDD